MIFTNWQDYFYNVEEDTQQKKMLERDVGIFESTTNRLARESKERAEADAQRRSDSLRNYSKSGSGFGAKRHWLK